VDIPGDASQAEGASGCADNAHLNPDDYITSLLWGLDDASLFGDATTLLRGPPLDENKTVVVLTPMVSSSSTPFFCVRGEESVGFLYNEFAEQLGSDQPFYELCYIDYDFKEVRDLATHFVDEIEKVRPDGPIQVGGWSFGGCVAYEIVLQLINRGREVSHLVLIDWVEKRMATASCSPQHAAFGALVRHVEWMCGKKLTGMDAVALQACNGLDFSSKFDLIINHLVDSGMLSKKVDRSGLMSVVRRFECAISAVLRHDAPPIENFEGAEVLAVRATEFGFPDMMNFDWGKVTAANSKVTLHEIHCCDHWEILRKPSVETLGKFVRNFLSKKCDPSANLITETERNTGRAKPKVKGPPAYLMAPKVPPPKPLRQKKGPSKRNTGGVGPMVKGPPANLMAPFRSSSCWTEAPSEMKGPSVKLLESDLAMKRASPDALALILKGPPASALSSSSSLMPNLKDPPLPPA